MSENTCIQPRAKVSVPGGEAPPRPGSDGKRCLVGGDLRAVAAASSERDRLTPSRTGSPRRRGDRRRVLDDLAGLRAARAGAERHQADVLVERDHVGRAVREPRQHPLADHALDLRAEARVADHVAGLLLRAASRRRGCRGGCEPYASIVPSVRSARAARQARSLGGGGIGAGFGSISASVLRASSGSFVISSSTPPVTAAAIWSRVSSVYGTTRRPSRVRLRRRTPAVERPLRREPVVARGVGRRCAAAARAQRPGSSSRRRATELLRHGRGWGPEATG